jgi:hypothetical protein
MVDLSNVPEDYLKQKIRKIRLLERYIEMIKKRQVDELKPLEDLAEGLRSQVMGFLQQTGQRFSKTEYGDAGIFTKIGMRVEDQEAFKNYVITSQDWEMIVWAVRRTTAESYEVQHKSFPPGVTVTKEQKLRVTAPTPTGKKRTPKNVQVTTGEQNEEKEFNAFEEPGHPDQSTINS